uniref:CUB domain-containing protein n=1 Tax=Steinernema glaseri TaxID=37863 RepID=A0A1I7YZQ7_9BILA
MSVNQRRVVKVLECFGQSLGSNVEKQCAEDHRAEYQCHGEAGDSRFDPVFNIQCGYPYGAVRWATI